MAKRNGTTVTSTQKPIEQYEHKGKERLNNPPVGLVDAHTDNGGFKKKEYQYDPHIDPQLQWAGKAEHTSFEVPTVSLHVHERIDPRRIMETVKSASASLSVRQLSLFEEEKMPLREAIEFYKHKENWSNRLIAGDSLLVMNSLLEKEGMGGKVQMIYFDPPYGIKYGSNFQPFVNKRDVKDGKDGDLTAEPEMIKAFRDTWELGIHSYLTYLRDRLLLARELLSESGSVFVQISDENVHLVKSLMEEVFSVNNYIGTIILKTRSTSTSKFLSILNDYIIWFTKDKDSVKYRELFEEKPVDHNRFSMYESDTGELLNINNLELGKRERFKVFSSSSLNSTTGGKSSSIPFKFRGKEYFPAESRSWRCSIEGLKRLASEERIFIQGNSLRYKYYYTDFPYYPITNLWTDQLSEQNKIFVVQTSIEAIKRCMLMSTDPGDLVLDITCGSGTTAYVAENWGRRWITCDTSRVAITLAKQRLMTANFDYFQLAYPEEGVDSGFKYKTVPHITLKSIANNEPAQQETLYDQPFIDTKRARVTGPFTVEAVPAPVVKSFASTSLSTGADKLDITDYTDSHASTTLSVTEPFSMTDGDENLPDASIDVSRSGETLRQEEWRQELLKSGVRAKGGKLIAFSRVEPLKGTRYLQAEAETKVEVGNKDLFNKKQPDLMQQPQRVVICFGPEYAPLEQRLVELALEEAGHLHPKPQIVLFCAFQFDDEAAKDIDETNWPGITLLKAQMNADLLTDDLKKKRSSNESFWLVGQPDVSLTPALSPSKTERASKGEGDKKQYQVEVRGFDYYNPKTGKVESGGKGDIAMWMLDPDYDGRSLFPAQVFFPMADATEGWAKLAKNLKAEIDEEKIEAFRGTVSLPFVPGKSVAVKIIDARGIESLKIIRV